MVPVHGEGSVYSGYVAVPTGVIWSKAEIIKVPRKAGRHFHCNSNILALVPAGLGHVVHLGVP